MDIVPKWTNQLANTEAVYPSLFYTVSYRDAITPQIVKTFSLEENLIWTELEMWGVKNPIVKTFEEWLAEVE